MALDKTQLAGLVNAALQGDHVVDDVEMQDILDQASVNGISAREISDARDLLKGAETELAAAKAGYEQANRNLDHAEHNWDISGGFKAGGDAFKAKMAVRDAQGRRDAYAKLSATLYQHATDAARTGADIGSTFKDKVVPFGQSIRDFFDR